MAVTLQQIRAQPGYQGLSDDEIVKHVNSHGLDVEGYDPIQPPPEEAGAARSYVGIPLSKGVADIGGAAGYGLEAAGFEKAGRYLQDSNQQAQDMLTARQSKRAQEDAGKTLIDDNGNYGGYNLGTLAQDVFASAPGTLAMGMAGAPLAKVGTVASKALGIGEKLAKVAGSGVLGKGLAAGIDTAIGSAVGFGASEGVYSGASNAAQIQNEIRNTDINKMSEHPVFVETYHKETDPSLTQDQRLYQTRDILARKAGDDVFADTAIKTGLISMATGGGVFGMVRGNATRAASDVAEGVLTKAVKGFALEGLAQEAPQSALEQRTMNQVKQDYVNQGQDLNQGVLNAGIQGGIAGGVMGLFGGAGGNAQVTHKEADQKPTNNLDLNAETSGEQTPLGLPAPNKGLEFNRSSNVPKDIIVFDDGSQIDAHEFYQDRLAEHGNEEQAKNETYSALNGKPNPVIGIPELVFTADGTALNKQDLIKGFTNNGATEQHALDYIKKITETPVNERTETNLDPYRFLQERDAQDSKRNDERFNAQQSDLPETDNRGSAEYDNATTVPGGGAAETQGINPINPVNSATQPQQENINGGEKNTSENAYAKTGQERPLNQPAPDQSGANPAIQRTNEETDQAITGAQPEIPGAGQNPPGITEAGEQAKGEPIGSDSGLPDVYKPYQGKITKTTAKEGIDYSALDDAKDAKGNPTGWKIFRYENQVGILNPATKETYVYQTTPNSGSDFARAHSVMGNLAADLATKRADNLPQGELVSTPVYGNKNESTNATTKQSQEMAESADTSRKNANDNESAYVPTNEVDKDAPVLGARREQDQRKLTFGADHANVTEEPNQGQVNVESSKTEIKAQKEKSGTQAAINPIITRSKGAHLVAKMNEFNQANPNAIAAAKKQNADKVKASYEEDLNRALASVPFDVYAQHSTNQWQPEGILRQAHDALRQEYGIKPPIEPDQNAPQSEWDKYDADNEAFYGNDEPYQPPTYKSIEQQKAERLVEKEAERIKLFRIIPDQVKRGADFVQSQADLKNAGVYLDAGHSNNEDRNNHRAYAEFKKTATPKQLKALSDYEKYIRAVNETTRSQDTKAKETAVSTEAEAGNAGSQSSDRKMLSPLATPDEYHYKEAQSAYQHSNRYGAQAARDSYVRSINNQHDRLNKDLNEAQKQYLDDSFIQLKKDYLEKEKPILAARSGMVSAHIAGRSKFDGRLATRGQSSYDRATEAHSQWFDREIGDIERGILNRRNDEQKASDKKKTDNKIVNKTVGAFAGSIGAMDEPGYDKSAFMPGARKQWAAIRALGDDVALNAIENINKVLTEESKTIEDVLGKRSKLWKEISEFLDSDTIKQQSSKQLEESKDAPDKAVVQPSNGQASGAEVDVKNELSNSVDDQKQENINDKTLLESHKDLNDRLNAGDITAEELKAEFEKLVADKDAAYAELNKLTKADLTKMYRVGYQRPDAKKADVVKDAYQGMLADFKIADGMISYGMTIGKGMSGADDGFTGAVRKFVNDTTDADIKDYAEQIAKAKEERAAKKAEVLAGMDNPETADDFGRIMRVRFDEKRAAGMEHNEAFNAARMEFTPEQREKFDSLVAEETRGKRQARADQQKTDVHVAAQTTEGQVIETKHTKTGADLFVVKAADRVDRDVYNHWNTTAKRLGGYYSSFKGAGAVPGFQFKTRDNADAFLKFLGGDVTDAKEAVQARRDAYADDKSQTAVERLNEMADRLEERGTDSLNQDRKANTHRHVGMAARAEAAAQSDIALAKTMRNIASAIESGDAKLLDRVRQKVQVEMLQGFIHSAQSDQLRKLYPNYADYERHQGEKPNKETADYAMFPQYTAYRSDLANLGRTLLETEGTKKLGQRIMKVADDVSDAYLKFAKDNIDKVGAFRTKGGERAAFASKSTAEESIWRSDYKGAAIVLPVKRGENLIILSPSEAIKRGVWKGDNDKKITLSADFGAELVEKIGKAARLGSRISVPWQFENAYDKRKRLAGMGIETPAELRSALREFIGLREAPKEADKIKEMERAMVGRQNDGLDFFPTPAGIADEMIDAADIKEGMSVLEPSAGMGHIAERIREAGVEPDVVELSNSRRELLEAKGFNVVGRDFMDINPREFFNYGDTFKAKDGTIGIMHGGELGSNRTKLLDKEGNSLGWFDRDELTGVQKNDALSGYDRIIMNPPFGDRRDALHVQHAYDLLNPGGRLVAIMGEGVFFGNDKKAQAFRDWLEQVGGTDEKLAEGTFNDPSLPVNTGVNARMVVIDKPEGDVKFSKSKSNTTNPHTEQSLLSAIRAALDSKFYSGWTDAAMATGKFKVISRDEALKISSGAGDAKGFYDPAAGGDTSYFVYNNISQDASAKELSGLVAHEVAVHALRLGKDDPDFKKLLKQFATMRKVNPAVRAAFARVPKDTKRKHILEEGLAYYLEGSGLNQSFKQKFVAAFRKMLRAIGKMMPVMQRTKWIRWANTLSEGDIITMANDALRAAPTSLQFDNAGRQGDSISLAKEQGYLLASAPQQRFYSALRKAFRDAPDKIFGNPTQVKLWLNSNAAKFDVKKDEIYWSGVNDWLDTLTGKVSKDEVLTFLDQNGVKVEDVALGEGYKGLPKEEGDRHNYLINKPSGYWSDEESGYIEAEPLTESEEKELNELQEKIQKGIAENKKAKHNTSQLTLPGGTDYRELVITILTIEKYNESDETHFGDVGNGRQIAWVRMNSRTDANGNTTQFLEEVQSQRGAKGRREGFSAGKRLTELPSNYKAIKEYDTWNVVDENGDEYAPFSATKERAIIEALDRINNNFNKVPPAPFVTDSNNKATNAYISLVMKKAISAAIDAGHDSVSWTTATQQADRYDLSKQISSVEYIPDTKTLRAFDLGGKSVIDQVTKPDQVQDYVGKEVAQRLFDSEPVLTGSGKQIHRVAGGDLKIGGAWTQAMYGDENGLNAQGQPALITQTAGAIAKKFGGKMGSIKLDIGTQPALIITPEMKAKILNEGMPLFSMRNTKASDTIEWSGTAHEYTDLKVKPGMRNEKLEAMVAQYVGVDGKPSRKELQEAVWQYREIEAEYFNKDGSQKKGAMLAPNGEKTTLNKSQWIMTRTDNFEKWFGDSQAIDENGDPRIFYHGTNADFNTFDSNKSFRKGKLFFTTDKDLAEQYGDKTLHVFLKANRIKTVTTSGQFIDALDNFTISDTFDGIEYIDTSELGNAIHQIVVFKPSQIKSTGNTGTFNPESSDIRFSKSGGNDWKDQAGFDGLSDEVLATLGKIGRPPGQGIIEKAKSQLEKHRYLWRNKLKQGMFDQFDSFKSILNDNRSWMMANISNTGGAVVESALEFGTPFMDKSGAIDINTGAKSLGQILEPLGDEVDRFLMWIAGNRAEGLKLDGKENLFSDGDIKNLKSLAGGNKTGKPRAIIYNAVRRDFEAMHDAFVKIGVDTGLVNAEEAALWKEQGFYIPFYRLAEEDENAHQGPSGIGGLVKQQAYKKLKGADMQLNDLLGNTVMNWNHLVNAGLKNQAAAKALESAKEMGLAKNIPAALKGKRSVYVRRDGLEHWYDLGESQEAQLVLDSLTALNWQGLNNFAMKVMRTFKRALTVGVTASPEFKIANLLRDSIQAIAVSDMDTNIAKNMYNGFKYSENGSVTKARMIAGGGAFGDSGYIHGGDPDAIKLVLEKSAKRANILDSRHAIKRMWDAYQDFGARLENVNRMANFEQALAQGKDLLTANFEARDQLDFQRTGSFTTIRALTQVIPFLGARMQGLDKLARSMADPKQRKQFIAVAGTYAMLSVLLFLAMKDDDDYKNAEQWERDSYHLFKLPGSDVMYRIPRPFEVGAIATMIERGVEQMVDDKVHGELFAERLKFALMNTLSIDIVPQALKPINEIWANKSTFTGRYIESQSMQNLSTTERKKAWTSQTAIGLSKAMDAILWDQVVLSPVQIEHLVNGYLGWAGATTLAGIDQIARPLVGAPAQPAMRLEDYPVIGRFMREGDGRNSRFITEFYDKQKELSQQFADIKQYRDNKEFDKYQEAMSEHKDDQRQRTYFNHVNKQITGLNNKIKLITANPSLSSEVKRDQIDLLNQRRIRLAKSAVDRIN